MHKTLRFAGAEISRICCDCTIKVLDQGWAPLCREGRKENIINRECCSGTEREQRLSAARLCLVPLQMVPRKRHAAVLQLHRS